MGAAGRREMEKMKKTRLSREWSGSAMEVGELGGTGGGASGSK